jgi:hypothetical protein
MVNREFLRCFLMRTQDPILGGFCKYEGSFSGIGIPPFEFRLHYIHCSDVMHTYLSISALSIFNEPLLHPVFCPLNISSRSYERLLKKNGSNPIINGWLCILIIKSLFFLKLKKILIGDINMLVLFLSFKWIWELLRWYNFNNTVLYLHKNKLPSSQLVSFYLVSSMWLKWNGNETVYIMLLLRWLIYFYG